MNPILQYFQELVIRLTSKSPKFFKILQIVSAATALIAGLPVFLQWLGVDLTQYAPWATVLENKLVAVAAFVAAFIAGLPVKQNPETSATATLKSNDKTVALPFTDTVSK